MQVDIEELVTLHGFFWRPYTVGGVLTKGPVECWLPDGRVLINGKEILFIKTTEELVAISDALKL